MLLVAGVQWQDENGVLRTSEEGFCQVGDAAPFSRANMACGVIVMKSDT
jgi:hypothetical protein